ncbi:hypothetical protein RYX36_003649 [Vicia faba]
MKGYNDLLHHPRKELNVIEKQIREGEELVQKCKKLTLWNFFSFLGHQAKLQKKDEKLKRHLAVNVPLQNKRDLIVLSAKVDGILDILTRMMNSGQFDEGLCAAPEEPECLGMVEPLNKLKNELIKDGVSIVKRCKGSPLALEVIAGSLCQQPFEKWQNMKQRLKSQSIFESDKTNLLCYLQQSLEILEDINEKECFI